MKYYADLSKETLNQLKINGLFSTTVINQTIMEKTKEVLHTQGELWIDDDGFIAIGSGDNYRTFAEIDPRFYAAEKEANKDEMVLRWNSYKRLIDSNRELLKNLEIAVERLYDEGYDNGIGTVVKDMETAINNAKNLQP